jgi:hypothetical protein
MTARTLLDFENAILDLFEKIESLSRMPRLYYGLF